MLFNTLTYAVFFAVVFGVSWILANRRWVPLLPWFAVGGTVALHAPSAWGAALAALSLALSLALCRKQHEDQVPTRRIAAASVAVNFAALAFITTRHGGVDPVTAALSGLGIPVPASKASMAVAGLAGALGAYLLVRARKVRLLFILGASYVFYAHWDWRFLPLIFGSSSIDWLLGKAIAREQRPRQRKLWLVGTVVLNLGVLGIFKYFNFGVDTARAALESFGFAPPEVALRIALPVGISFFTFESMSYVIDVYRREIEPQKSYVEYLSFVAFFPHLVAGPIVRPRDLLPQLAGPPRWNPAEGSEALFLIALGLIKKVAIGDYLAVNLVDRVFDTPAQYSALECYTAVLGYAVQIYCDFSGYTDIAIGSALLLGVRFPLNFNAPYKAINVQDFWRRWHISLSTWLRDYLYVPLGGNRKGPRRTYVNLMITMLLGGLWHGAAWTFVVWGGLHGAALAATRWWQRDSPWARRRNEKATATRLPGEVPGGVTFGNLAAAFLTFHFVCICWVFFRAETFQKAWTMFRQMGTLTVFHPNLHPPILGVLAVGLLSHWVPERWYAAGRTAFIRVPAPVQGLALLMAALVLREMVSAEAVPFVYFQF